MESEKRFPIVDKNTPISLLDCSDAFNQLSDNDKLYAFYFSRASWEGVKTLFFDKSYESPVLIYLFGKIFTCETVGEFKTNMKAIGVSDSDLEAFLRYVSAVFKNCGNYLDYGDTKFVPEIDQELFKTILLSTSYCNQNQEESKNLFEQIKHEIFEFSPPYYGIGFIDSNCLSGYYTPNITREDAEFVAEAMKNEKLSPLNTRLHKIDDKTYHILIASVEEQTKEFIYKDCKFKCIYGEFSNFLAKLNENLEKCMEFANPTQKEMLKHYINHFKTGNIEAHMDSQRSWIRDINPVVETNIGYIETYLDPLQVRAMFEGWVSLVDQEQSKLLDKLVESAETILPLLPWPREFEKDKFLKPNFTSLKVLSNAHGGVPLGINLPNYDEITQVEGFKNLYLQNCNFTPKLENIRFFDTSDQEKTQMYIKYFNDGVFLNVALHELMGHGSGKLFYNLKEGEYNFDKEKVRNPLNGEPITSFYNPGELWNMRFGKITNAYEECRADTVALYLLSFDEPLAILFKGREKEWDDIRYSSWIRFLIGWIRGLEVYDPESGIWGESHRQGNHVIVSAILKECKSFLKVKEIEKNGKPYFYIDCDRDQIRTGVKEALGKFLLSLQVYKTTGDADSGKKMFEELSRVDEFAVKLRSIMLQHRIPRTMEVQIDTKLNEHGQIEIVKFSESFEGLIESHLFHYGGRFDDIIKEWERYNMKYFRYKPSN